MTDVKKERKPRVLPEDFKRKAPDEFLAEIEQVIVEADRVLAEANAVLAKHNSK